MSEQNELKSPVRYSVGNKQGNERFGVGFSSHDELFQRQKDNGGGTIILCCSCGGGGSANVTKKVEIESK